jgi:hypothetical protein
MIFFFPLVDIFAKKYFNPFCMLSARAAMLKAFTLRISTEVNAFLLVKVTAIEDI